MKRIIILFVMLSVAKHLTAQNVGVGTNTPGEKLDVNGNVNVQGNVKVNGNAGTAGQVLMMNESGQQNWVNAFGYKNRREFFGASSFTVPTGVREIMIEIVSGGGGGAKGGGGGGSAYAIGIYKVVPAQVIIINSIGAGGTGSATENGSGTTGGITLVSGTGISITSYGATGATSAFPGSFDNYIIFGDSLIYSKGFYGSGGKPTTESYAQYNSTNFVTMRKYGDGGACMYNPNAIHAGTFFSFNTVTLANISFFYPPSNVAIGAGGGGGNTGSGSWGGNGGAGLAAISW